MKIRDVLTEQGVAEGHADQQRKIVKQNGRPVGEVGIDRESSPGVGQYYMKHYASGTDNSGYDSAEEALGDLRHFMKQSVYGELREKGVSEAIDIGQEWMTDTELDQYVPDQLQQQWRELVGYDAEGNVSALWANITGGYEPDANDTEDRANMVRVANKWFAMKRIPNVRFFDVRDVGDELEWLVQIGSQGVAEGAGKNLSVEQLATVSDAALDQAYGYGRSTPGKTFGWQANLMSAAYAKKMIDAGVTDIERIADAIHRGWNVTAQKFVQDPDQFADTEKLRAAGKLEAKLDQRAKLMGINYAQLPDQEQEKDRVVARALLQAMRG